MPTWTWISTFGGRLFSTSFLILLSRNGFRIRCSCSMIDLLRFSLSASDMASSYYPKLNHSSKSSELEKISGSRKLSKDQSSCKLFYRGVPVRSNLYRLSSWRRRFEIWLSSFFSLWASSTITYSHLKERSLDMHARTPSNVVKTTSNFPGSS